MAWIFPLRSYALFDWLRVTLTTKFDWVFMTSGNLFVVFCLLLICSPLGRIRLGGDQAKPDFGYFGWFSMLFAAGMGIGLMFYGVSEPVTHFTAALEGGTQAPLGGLPLDPESARQLAMSATIFHWALHPWAIYAIVGLALAFFTYNWKLPLTFRSAFYPIFGEKIWGWPGHIIDILAVFATLFGLATSLGFGAEQAVSGLHYLFNFPNSISSRILLIIVITAMALTSVLAGLDRGVRRLSELNMCLAFLLMIFVLLVGPTKELLGGVFTNTVEYVRSISSLSNPFARHDDGYRLGWTTFYWAWWMSWSPFVGMFIARVSRGRTVREFLTCVLIIPSSVSVLWMTVFGGTALHETIGGFDGITKAALPLKLFKMLEVLPLASLTSLLGIVLVIVFFVTSSDSGSLVIDTITAGGKVDAPLPQRAFWAILEGVVAIVLLLGGGLKALQSASVATGFPFALLLILLCWSTLRGLMREASESAARVDDLSNPPQVELD